MTANNNEPSAHHFKDACMIFCIFLSLIAAIESALYLKFYYEDEINSSFDERSQADTYGGAPWTEDYFKELEESRLDAHWKPYVYWRRNPHGGAYVNVAEDGLRVTPSGASTPALEASRPLIFMFGGSTMWGTGARDSFAIPAVLSQELKKRGVDADVRNFGETGYVSGQELAALIDQLRRGETPDLVIFYDGVNDTFSAYQQGAAGLPQNEMNRAREFNLTNPKRRGDLLKESLESTSTMRFMRGFMAAIGPGDQGEGWARDQAADRIDLARDVVAAYGHNVRMAAALAEVYGFKTLAYWQPTIFEKTSLSAYEQRALEGIDSHHKAFFDQTYDVMRDEGRSTLVGHEFHDLSVIFSDVQESLYIDWMHLGERGNVLVAKRMVDDALRLIDAAPWANKEESRSSS